jgi:transposase-like protein
MSRKLNQVVWDQWRQRTEGQRTSGLSIVEFCRREGISQTAFYSWKRKLRGPSSARTSSREAAAEQCSGEQRAVVRKRRRPRNLPGSSTASSRPAEFLQLPVRGVHSSPWIELTLVDGTLVRVPQENMVAFTTLLRVLRGDDFAVLSGETRRA